MGVRSVLVNGVARKKKNKKKTKKNNLTVKVTIE